MSTVELIVVCIVGWVGFSCTCVLLFAVVCRREDRERGVQEREAAKELAVVIELPVEHGHIVVHDLRQREHARDQ